MLCHIVSISTLYTVSLTDCSTFICGVHVHVYYYSLVFLFNKLIYLLRVYLIIHCHTDSPSVAVEVMATPSASTDVLG